MLNELENLKQYLLGNLAEGEMEKIDLKVISEKNFEETILIAENDLIEDFIEQNLSQKELELFYQNFLISPEREKMVEQVAALKKLAKREVSEETISQTDPDSDDGYFQLLFRALNLQPAKAAFAVIGVGLVFGTIWVLLINGGFNNDSGSLETEFAKLNKGEFSQVENYKENRNLSLTPGVPRSGDEGARLNKENLTERVFIRLALPPQIADEEYFSVQFVSDENEVFNQNEIYSVNNKSGKELRFLVPGSILEKGEYLIKVKGVQTPEIIYSFFVE